MKKVTIIPATFCCNFVEMEINQMIEEGYIISQIHYQMAPFRDSIEYSALVEYEDKEDEENE